MSRRRAFSLNTAVVGIGVILGGLLVSGCELNFYKEKQALDSAGIDPKKLSYEIIRSHILGPRCVSCHGTSGGISLESYSAVRQHLSKIERVTLQDLTMPPKRPLSQGDQALLKAWITAGAPETSPDAPAVIPIPLEPTYTSIRRNILETRCLSCHSPGEDAAKIPLLTYRDLLDSPHEIVLPGNSEESGLVIAVTREDDKRMPPRKSGGKRLTDEEIAVIKNWIDQGAPEN